MTRSHREQTYEHQGGDEGQSELGDWDLHTYTTIYLPSNTEDARDAGLIPVSGMATHSNILAWKIPWLSWGVTVHEHTRAHRAFMIGQLVKILPATQETPV